VITRLGLPMSTALSCVVAVDGTMMPDGAAWCVAERHRSVGRPASGRSPPSLASPARRWWSWR
jgi:hypothetical protein